MTGGAVDNPPPANTSPPQKTVIARGTAPGLKGGTSNAYVVYSDNTTSIPTSSNIAEKENLIAQAKTEGTYQGEGGGTINSPNRATEEAKQKSGITYQSEGGGAREGGGTARDIYVGTLLAEYNQGFKGTYKTPEDYLSNRLGQVKLAFNSQTKVISDPLMQRVKAENAANTLEGGHPGGYAGLSSSSGIVGPQTSLSKQLGSSKGQEATGYIHRDSQGNVQLNYSQEQVKSLISAQKNNPEYGGNQNFLVSNINTENSIGSTSALNPTGTKNTPPLVKADLSSLGPSKENPFVISGGHILPAGLVYVPSEQEIASANLAREQEYQAKFLTQKSEQINAGIDRLVAYDESIQSIINDVKIKTGGGKLDVFENITNPNSVFPVHENNVGPLSLGTINKEPTIPVLIGSVSTKSLNAKNELENILANNQGKDITLAFQPIESQNIIGQDIWANMEGTAEEANALVAPPKQQYIKMGFGLDIPIPQSISYGTSSTFETIKTDVLGLGAEIYSGGVNAAKSANPIPEFVKEEASVISSGFVGTGKLIGKVIPFLNPGIEYLSNLLPKGLQSPPKLTKEAQDFLQNNTQESALSDYLGNKSYTAPGYFTEQKAGIIGSVLGDVALNIFLAKETGGVLNRLGYYGIKLGAEARLPEPVLKAMAASTNPIAAMQERGLLPRYEEVAYPILKAEAPSPAFPPTVENTWFFKGLTLGKRGLLGFTKQGGEFTKPEGIEIGGNIKYGISNKGLYRYNTNREEVSRLTTGTPITSLTKQIIATGGEGTPLSEGSQFGSNMLIKNILSKSYRENIPSQLPPEIVYPNAPFNMSEMQIDRLLTLSEVARTGKGVKAEVVRELPLDLWKNITPKQASALLKVVKKYQKPFAFGKTGLRSGDYSIGIMKGSSSQAPQVLEEWQRLAGDIEMLPLNSKKLMHKFLEESVKALQENAEPNQLFTHDIESGLNPNAKRSNIEKLFGLNMKGKIEYKGRGGIELSTGGVLIKPELSEALGTIKETENAKGVSYIGGTKEKIFEFAGGKDENGKYISTSGYVWGERTPEGFVTAKTPSGTKILMSTLRKQELRKNAASSSLMSTRLFAKSRNISPEEASKISNISANEQGVFPIPHRAKDVGDLMGTSFSNAEKLARQGREKQAALKGGYTEHMRDIFPTYDFTSMFAKKPGGIATTMKLIQPDLSEFMNIGRYPKEGEVFYHGTSAENVPAILKNGFNLKNEGEGTAEFFRKQGYNEKDIPNMIEEKKQNAVFLSSQKEFANRFNNGALLEIKLNPKTKILDLLSMSEKEYTKLENKVARKYGEEVVLSPNSDLAMSHWLKYANEEGYSGLINYAASQSSGQKELILFDYKNTIASISDITNKITKSNSGIFRPSEPVYEKEPRIPADYSFEPKAAESILRMTQKPNLVPENISFITQPSNIKSVQQKNNESELKNISPPKTGASGLRSLMPSPSKISPPTTGISKLTTPSLSTRILSPSTYTPPITTSPRNTYTPPITPPISNKIPPPFTYTPPETPPPSNLETTFLTPNIITPPTRPPQYPPNINLKTMPDQKVLRKLGERANFLGNSSISQVVGLYNRNEIIYGRVRTAKIASQVFTKETKGFPKFTNTKSTSFETSKPNKLITTKSTNFVTTKPTRLPKLKATSLFNKKQYQVKI